MTFPVPPDVVITTAGMTRLPILRAANISYAFAGSDYGLGGQFGWFDSNDNFQPFMSCPGFITENQIVNMRAGHGRAMGIEFGSVAPNVTIQMRIIEL